MHIVIPYAAWQAGAADGLARPHLQAFLAANRAQPVPLPDEALDFYLPHEALLAQLYQLDGAQTGTVPWAAWQRGQAGLDSSGAWARITLCHWQMGMREARLHPPGPLAISQAQADALWHSLGEWLAQDGITLVPSASGAPFERDAQADWFADLPSVSMRRAAQGSLMDAAQKGRNPSAQKIARLQRLAFISNAAIVLVLISGIARLYGGMLDSGWLMRNHLFHIKMALFLALVALGLPTMRAYQRWGATYASNGQLPSESEINTARRWMMASSHLMLLIPLFAVLVARGYGSWGL